MVELLVKKAAGLRFGDSSHRSGDGNTSASTPSFPILECDKPEDMLDRLFELSAYKYPDTITLPTDYNPPSLAIATAYWKVT